MTEETRAKVENKIIKMSRLADEICDEFKLCKSCPLGTTSNGSNYNCSVGALWWVADDIEMVRVEENEEEPTYEDLPIDLDDDYHCDECYKPVFNECLTDKYNDDCPYDLGECCEDNLATNVGRICFEHNVPTNFAMAIIEIIQKERDRNEYLHLYRKHFPAE